MIHNLPSFFVLLLNFLILLSGGIWGADVQLFEEEDA
jgi:hypothetical protein